MKSTTTAIATLLAGGAIITTPAVAQPGYGGQAAPQQTTEPRPAPEAAQGQAAPQASQNPNAIQTHQPKVSRKAAKPIQELQNAVKSNDPAAIAAALAAAQAAASSADDRYAIAILQLQSAAQTKNNAGVAAGLEAMLASGAVLEEEQFSLYLNLGQTYSAINQNDRAAQAFQQALQRNPSSVDATAGLAEARAAQGQTGEALTLLQKGIALQSAGGARPSESWFKRAVQIAYKAKAPQAVQIGRDWVQAYPTTENWTNVLAIYQNLVELDEARTLDLMRLKRATGALTASDYFNYGDIAVRRGFAGEAKAVLDEGFAANPEVDRKDPSFSQLYTLANQRTKGDRESLPASPAAGANARQTLNVGDAYFGYGDYAKAVEFYRAALGRPGADADLINLHLGMALARQGDRAGATAALNSVGGAHAELAKFWLIHLANRA